MLKFKNVKTKRYLIFILVLFVLVCVFLFNLIHQNSKADFDKDTINKNLSTISTFDFSKVSTVEEQVKALDTNSDAGSYSVGSSLSKSRYQQIFSHSVVVGDSVTEGLSDFGFLNSDQVFCRIGASLMKDGSMFTQAAATEPRYAFFAFGMNDMGYYNGSSTRFIARYKSLLKSFKKRSPNTKIYINSISIPAPSAIKKDRSLRHYRKFNSAIRTMCSDMGYTYIDNTYILKENKSFYASDGIHVNPGYYREWLNNMITKAGL